MAHIIRENAGKKTKTISELFTNKIFEFTFVSIFADMTILRTHNLSMRDCIISTQLQQIISTCFQIVAPLPVNRKKTKSATPKKNVCVKMDLKRWTVAMLAC